MKTFLTFLISFCFVGLSYGQTIGDMTTNQTGSWNDKAIWDFYVGGGTWVPNISYPSAGSGASNTILLNHNVTLGVETIAMAAKVEVSSGSTLTVNGTGKLILTPTGNLIVDGTFNNNNGASGFVIQSTSAGTGSLISSSSHTGTLQAYLTGGGWHLVGPPNDDLLAGDAFLTGYMQTWADGNPNGDWTVQDGTNPALARGRGAAYYFFSSFTAGMTGSLNGAAKTIGSLTNANPGVTGQSGNGWHLLANPFPCAVDLDDCTFTGANSSTYLVYNGASYVTPSGNVLGASQGFFMQVNSGTSSVVFLTAAKVESHLSIAKSQETDLIELSLSDNEGVSNDRLTVRFNEQATFDYEGEFDGHKIIGNSKAGEIMAQITGEEIACVLGIPFTQDITTVKVNFKKGDATEYTLELAQNLLTNMDVSLEDTETNTIVDLNSSPVYTFSADDSQDARFLLHFRNTTSIQELSNYDNIRVWENDGVLNIDQDDAQKGFVQVYDVSGKQLLNANLTESANQKVSIANFPHGVYVVKVIVGNESYSQKIIK